MKKSIVFLAALALGNTMYAKSLTQDQARAAAQEFLNSKDNGRIRLTDNAIVAYGEPAGRPAFYVFAAAGNKGFVIASADDEHKLNLGFASSTSSTPDWHSVISTGQEAGSYTNAELPTIDCWLCKDELSKRCFVVNAAGTVLFELKRDVSPTGEYFSRTERDALDNFYFIIADK